MGLDLNRAARIASTANGGQIVISAELHDEVSSVGLTGVSYRDLGLHRLKDLPRPRAPVPARRCRPHRRHHARAEPRHADQPAGGAGTRDRARRHRRGHPVPDPGRLPAGDAHRARRNGQDDRGLGRSPLAGRRRARRRLLRRPRAGPDRAVGVGLDRHRPRSRRGRGQPGRRPGRSVGPQGPARPRQPRAAHRGANGRVHPPRPDRLHPRRDVPRPVAGPGRAGDPPLAPRLPDWAPAPRRARVLARRRAVRSSGPPSPSVVPPGRGQRAGGGCDLHEAPGTTPRHRARCRPDQDARSGGARRLARRPALPDVERARSPGPPADVGRDHRLELRPPHRHGPGGLRRPGRLRGRL